MTRLWYVGNLPCIGGGGCGSEETCAEGKEGVVGDGGRSNVGEVGAGVEAGGGGDGGGGGEDSPSVMLRSVSSPAPRSFSGVGSSLGVETDRRVAAIPLFLARTAALWLARDAVNAALVLFSASGRTL